MGVAGLPELTPPLLLPPVPAPGWQAQFSDGCRLPGMAENNVSENDATRSCTKFRFLCAKKLKKAREKGITSKDIKDAYTVMKKEWHHSVNIYEYKYADATGGMSAKQQQQWGLLGVLVVLTIGVALSCCCVSLGYEFVTSKCLIRNNYIVMEATRPHTNCKHVCCSVRGAVELNENISREEFARWAYLSRPLVVRGGAAHWPALDKLTVSFLQSLYNSIEGSYETVADECQFLPFRSEFIDLKSALTTHPALPAACPGTKHWYFGW